MMKFCFTGLRLAASLYEVMTVLLLGGSLDVLRQGAEPLTSAGANMASSLIKCTLQSTPHLPAFLMDGDFVIGGVFSLHYEIHRVI